MQAYAHVSHGLAFSYDLNEHKLGPAASKLHVALCAVAAACMHFEILLADIGFGGMQWMRPQLQNRRVTAASATRVTPGLGTGGVPGAPLSWTAATLRGSLARQH